MSPAVTVPAWAPSERLFHERARAELRAGATGQAFSPGPLQVHASVLPLIRRGATGGLEQAVSLIVESPEDGLAARFSLELAGRPVDAALPMLRRGRQALRLFLPEVSKPSPVSVRVAAGGTDDAFDLTVLPVRKWQVYIAQQTHLDVGYTDPQNLVFRHHLHYLDSVLDLVSSTDQYPDDSRFRWNVEGTWVLRRWLRSRPPSRAREFMDRVREGRIGIDALSFNLHTEACSIDEFACQLAIAAKLREEHNIPITTATQTDVPGASQALVGLLADADVPYLSVAHNFAGRAVPYVGEGQLLARPFRWRSNSGHEVVVWYTDSAHGLYSEGNVVGLAESYDATVELLPEYLAALAERPYPYVRIEQAMTWPGLPRDLLAAKVPYPHDILHLRVQGVIADNAPPNPTAADVVRTWNQNWVYPRLRLATNAEFFTAVAERLGPDLPIFTGDWTDWWADGLGSAAREVGLNRRAQSDLALAATVHQLADVVRPADAVHWRTPMGRAMDSAALFDEHTWGAAEPWGDALERRNSGALQWREKAGFALSAYERSQDLLDSAAHRLSPILASPAGPSVAVFNPSPWARTDVVEVFLPESRIRPVGALEVIDEATGLTVAHNVRPQEHERHRPRGARLTFVASAVPALGYRRYLYRTARGDTEALAPPPQLFLENEYYLVQVDSASGCVTRLFDRRLDEELVDSRGAVGFNQYVHDRYAVAANVGHLSSRVSAADWLLRSRVTAGEGRVIERVRNEIYDEVRLSLAADGCSRLETTYRLVQGVPRLEIENRLVKLTSAEKESTYFAFPFSLSDPLTSLRYETTGGADGPDLPRIPGSASHMRAIRHWVALRSRKATIAWASREAPLVEFGNIHLPYSPFPESIDRTQVAPSDIFSWVTNNVWDTNFPVQQGGEMVFRYAVTSVQPDTLPAEAGALTAAGLTRPFMGVLCARSRDAGWPATGSFCEIDHRDVALVALRPSRRGADLVVQLQSLADEEVETRLRFPQLWVRRAQAGTFLEDNLSPLFQDAGWFHTRLRPGEFRAIALELES
ncbi:MAG: hypothetical protein JF888_08465 [Candidatus Dormibacteraeota bacterium]|uniref:Glycoside hydrolase family 38 N-terminal domain-containing protein n=1 Tax=Candidatus Dormiibacter inghamiae TaxID=3127013 RepID=A0A934KIA1_9BACT|nr:hypothetical protein [Candidatus Dormibacteraeota bacterium]MBJ7607656.1 hypothetical protein [Candidatus Dormibacteraeota bacterium]